MPRLAGVTRLAGASSMNEPGFSRTIRAEAPTQLSSLPVAEPFGIQMSEDLGLESNLIRGSFVVRSDIGVTTCLASRARRDLIMTSKPRFALAAGIALSGIVLAGCGSTALGQASAPASSGSASSGAGSSAAAVTAPSVNPGGPMATAGGTAAGGTKSATECTARQLRIAYTDNSQIRNGALDGMSHADHVVMFTNEGSASCRIQGYPGTAALNSAGTQIKQAARSAANAPLIVLAPGQTASAMVMANTASCTALTSVAGLLVTAPDQRTSTQLGPAGKLCLNSLAVGTVQAGNAAGLKL